MALRCEKCEKTFPDSAHLRRHLQRVTSCEPIKPVAMIEAPPGKGIKCKYCNKEFLTKTNMYRHIRKNCKIANSDAGMELLMDSTLQKQNELLSEEVRTLTEKLGQQSAAPTVILAGPTTINITINAWDSDQRIYTDVMKIISAFAENKKLKEYLGLDDADRCDAVKAPPYVETLLVDQIQRAHKSDPAFRNVYLNPKRSDQGMVFMKVGRWEVLPLIEVIQHLFDTIMANIKQITLSREDKNRLSIDVQNALAILNMVYEGESGEYAVRAKAAMSAHLANMAAIINQS